MDTSDLSHLRVLVLDDSHQMIALLRTILANFGVRDLVESRDAVEAIERVRDSRPDIALVDYQLGEISGLEFVRLIRNAEDSPNRRLPVIMVTAFSERRTVMEAVNGGVNEFLVKPIRPIDLFRRIQAVIEHPRDYVDVKDCFGPGRRRSRKSLYRGPDRRAAER